LSKLVTTQVAGVDDCRDDVTLRDTRDFHPHINRDRFRGSRWLPTIFPNGHRALNTSAS
jgi:hypothetical protein